MSISYYRCFCYILLICLISFGKCDNDQNYKKLELDEKVEGKMDKDESREYFELKLPHDIEKGSLLVFTVKESRTGIKEGEEIFSDPDIYLIK